MSWYTSGQNDQNVRYFLLNSAHGSYESKRAIIESLSPNYTLDDGAVANTKVVRGYVTDAEIASNGLDIGGAVLDRVHHYVNPNAATVTIRTSDWGDKHPVWGVFLEQPEAIPTDGIDRLVAWWKSGTGETVLYVGQTAQGDGSGDSYANRKAVKDILAIVGSTPTHDPTQYTILVLCGRLSRFNDEGNQDSFTSGSGLRIKNGSSGTRTQVLSHPADPFEIMSGPKCGSGSWNQAAFTNDTGNRWMCQDTTDTSGGGGGGMFPFVRHIVTDINGDVEGMTLVASKDDVTSTPYSWFVENVSDADTRLYVNIGGPDPTDHVFAANYRGGGISLVIANTTYFDVYGGTFYQCFFAVGAALGSSHFGFYGSTFELVANDVGGRVFGCASGDGDETTGTFTPDQPSNRIWQGCTFRRVGIGIYDINFGHDKVPLNTTIRDNYFEDCNLIAADNFGISVYSSSDAHSITCQGCDGWNVINNRMHRCGSQPIVIYLQPNNFTTPSGGLENEPLYTDGFLPSRCFDAGGGTSTYVCRAENVLIENNFVTEPRRTGGYATDDMGIALNGDSTQLLGLDGAYSNIVIQDNWLEGAHNNGAIRIKYSYPDGDTDTPIIRRNVIRGAIMAFHAFDQASAAGVSYDPSFRFTDNDISVAATSSYFVYLANVLNPDHHIHYLDGNTYRSDVAGKWACGASESNNFATWKAFQPTGDTYEPTGTYTPLTTDTGSPSLTISGSSLLTSSLGSDPDGATSNLYYQWFKDGELITSAESASYNAAGQTGGFTLVILGTDAKGKAFLVTSNTLTLTDTPIIPSPTAGIPLSEEEYYRKLKKNEPPDETMELAPPVPRAVQTGVVTLSRPPVIRSDTALKLALERAEQIARERPKKRNRRKDDDWFILN